MGYVGRDYMPAHQPFSSNSLDLSAPEEAYSRNVCASVTLKFGYEGVFKIPCTDQSCRNSGQICKNTWSFTGEATQVQTPLKLQCQPVGPRQANLVLIAYASSEGSGDPAHPRSLARNFAARSYKQ